MVMTCVCLSLDNIGGKPNFIPSIFEDYCSSPEGVLNSFHFLLFKALQIHYASPDWHLTGGGPDPILANMKLMLPFSQLRI